MLLVIPNILDAVRLQEVQGLLRHADFLDGRVAEVKQHNKLSTIKRYPRDELAQLSTAYSNLVRMWSEV